MKRLFCLILCICVLVASSLPIAVYAEETEPASVSTPSTDTSEPSTEPTTKPTPVAKVTTQVTGVKTKFDENRSSSIVLNLTIKPASPARKVLLQRYSSEKKAFVTKKTYTTANIKKASLKVSIPKDLRKRTKSTWRIVVEESSNAKAYYSPNIKVHTRNIKRIKLSSKACCIYCLNTKKVIYEKNMNRRLKPASCTKIMTLIAAIETGRFKGTTSVTSAAVNVPAQRLHARVGDRYRINDLAYAMILGSSNDAAVMLARGTAGSVSSLVSRMNSIAKKKIHLKNTHFTNTYGVPNRTHYTTAYELSRITAYGYRNKQFVKVVSRKTYGFKSLKYGKKYGCLTADRMIKENVKGHIGGKTGFSETLGASYSGLFKYKGKVYAVTIMHAATKGIRWKDVRKLYKYVRKYGNSKY